MDIGEIEKIGDRVLPGMPVFPQTMPMKPPAQPQPTTPTPSKQPEKVPA